MVGFHTRILQISGNKNSGKTALSMFLINQLTSRGYRIGSLKHSSHDHPLDRPGSDSDLQRQSGSYPAVFATQEGLGVFYRIDGMERNQLLAEIFHKCDLVIVESHAGKFGPMIYVMGQNEGDLTIDLTERKPIAIVNDQGRFSGINAFRREDPRIIEFLISFFKFPVT